MDYSKNIYVASYTYIYVYFFIYIYIQKKELNMTEPMDRFTFETNY